MAAPQQLKLFSSSKFTTPVSADAVSSSPVIDLVAAVTDDNFLSCWRPGEHLVSKQYEKGVTIKTVKWKPDGNLLVVGYSDTTVRLIALDSYRVVFRMPIETEGSQAITYLACVHNLSGQRHLKRPDKDKPSWQALFADAIGPGQDQEEDALHAIPDLPQHLTFLEVDTALPKLSMLPMTGGTGEDMYVFSARQYLEYLFPPLLLRDINSVDVTVVGTQDGGIHLMIYNNFVIGSFNYGSSYGQQDKLPPVQLCHHASHPEVSTHSLLLRPQNGELNALYLVPMDLQFVSYSPANLSLLAYKATTLQQLLRYITQTHSHMKSEWKATRELPSRFLQNINEDLQSSDNSMNIVQALYHTVATGHVYPTVKEWLVDSLAERGHKRWDKAVVEGLTNLRALVHENMLPALERCALILSRLLGIARFHNSGESIGFTSAQITRLIDIVSGVTLACHKILLIVMEELELFVVFSSWLRFMIDQLASSSGSEELSEKEATMDNAKVLTYIQRYLMTSPLSLFLEHPTSEYWDIAKHHVQDDGPSLMELLDRNLKKRDIGEPYLMALPSLDFLLELFDKRCMDVFYNIANTEKRSVRFGPQPTKIELGGMKISKYDTRMCSVRRPDGIDGLTYTAVMAEERPGDIYVFRTSIQIINGISGAVMTTACGLAIQGGTIIDFKFLNDDTLLALWYPEGKPPVLLRIPLSDSQLSYSTLNDDSGLPRNDYIAHPRPTEMGELSPLTLPDDPNFVPFRMEIKAAGTARGDIPVRICLLGRDRVTYKVFTLPDDVEN